jgi:type IV secretion system protein VirB5
MAFPQRRLNVGTSVPAETPYLDGAREWDRRIGDAYAHARNWRLMAFAMIPLLCLFAAGYAYESTRVKIVAYYVPINENGRPGKVVLADNTYTPTRGEIAYFLSQWVKLTFSKSFDKLVLGDNLHASFAMLTGSAYTTMSEWAQQNDPLKNVGHDTRTVTVDQILQRTDQTWEVDWTETSFTDGARTGVARYTGLFSINYAPPASKAELDTNQLGLHINSISWSREGTNP